MDKGVHSPNACNTSWGYHRVTSKKVVSQPEIQKGTHYNQSFYFSLKQKCFIYMCFLLHPQPPLPIAQFPAHYHPTASHCIKISTIKPSQWPRHSVSDRHIIQRRRVHTVHNLPCWRNFAPTQAHLMVLQPGHWAICIHFLWSFEK